MTPFTLVMAYYENEGMLQEHAEHWLRLPLAIRAALHIIIVDDGSPEYPAVNALQAFELLKLQHTLAGIQFWRMGVDVRWNQDACRNVGVREAPTPWVLLTDMDHVVPAATWLRLMSKKLEKHKAYKFSRVTAPKMDEYKPHPNSWALTKKNYWAAGGYDEALAGNYGTDGDFLGRLRREANIEILADALIRYPRELIPDASTTTLERKSEQDRKTINRLCHERATITDWKPLHFSFPCTRVL